VTSAPDPAPLPGRGRRERRKHLTRRDLLAAGRSLFGEQGLYDSRIEDLARHAGVAKGTLYGYFENKEQLMEAVVTTGFAELLGHVQRRTGTVGTRTEVIERVVVAHLEFFSENPDLMRIFHQVRGMLKFERPDGLPLRRALEHYLGGIADVLAPGRTNGRARREALETATLLFGAISGVSSTHAALLGPDARGGRPRAVVRALASLVPAFEGPDGARGTAPPANGAPTSRPARPPRGRAPAARGRAAR